MVSKLTERVISLESSLSKVKKGSVFEFWKKILHLFLNTLRIKYLIQNDSLLTENLYLKITYKLLKLSKLFFLSKWLFSEFFFHVNY